MNASMLKVVGCTALVMMPVFGWSQDAASATAAQAPAEPAAAAAPAAPAKDGDEGKGLEIRIGGSDEPAADGSKDDRGIRVIVKGEEDGEAGEIRVAGQTVDKVLEKLEGKLDDEDMAELRDALDEVRGLKDGDGKRIVIHKSVEDDDDDAVSDIIPGVVAIVLLFGGPVLIVAIVSMNNRRKREMVHQTLDKIIAQGRDVPVELLDALDKGNNNGRSPLSRAAVNIALGIGLGAWLWAISGPDVATLGLIPLCIGIARLVAWKLESKDAATRV